MDWYFAAPFIHSASDRWLGNFVPNEGKSLRFFSVPAMYEHDRSRRVTGLTAWMDYLHHGSVAWREASRTHAAAGIVTCFPQLALTVALRKRLSASHLPLVAWTFNLGTLYTGIRQRLARATLTAVDRFIVHSRAEISACSMWLDLPATKFEFVPLQRAIRSVVLAEEQKSPFVLSMGSAHRDYRLLLSVLSELGYPAVVVAGPHAVAGLTIPPNVDIRSGLSIEQCYELVQRARLNVIPVANQHTASGQVTLLDAMMYGRPVVITECPASVDYVINRHDALLVRHGDHDDMKSALRCLWEDASMREAIGRAARNTAIDRFSDAAIGRAMGNVLRAVAQDL
jgi:hypothetical protein